MRSIMLIERSRSENSIVITSRQMKVRPGSWSRIRLSWQASRFEKVLLPSGGSVTEKAPSRGVVFVVEDFGEDRGNPAPPDGRFQRGSQEDGLLYDFYVLRVKV